MLWPRYLSWVYCALPLLLSSHVTTSWAATAVAAADPPRESNGLTDVVQWDNYTLFLRDQRIFLQ